MRRPRPSKVDHLELDHRKSGELPTISYPPTAHSDRTLRSCPQHLPPRTSLLRAFCLITLFLQSMYTLLVPPTADNWRVTVTAAWAPTSSLNVLRIRCLDLALRVEAVLLRTRTGGPPKTVCVTSTCRCRLLESPSLWLLTPAPHFLGPLTTKLRVPVTPVVLMIRLTAVFLILKVTPPKKALPNKTVLRPIPLTKSCRLRTVILPTPALLTATLFRRMLRQCGSKLINADPLELDRFIRVMAPFPLIARPTRPRTLPPRLQSNETLPNLTPLPILPKGRGRIGLRTAPLVPRTPLTCLTEVNFSGTPQSVPENLPSGPTISHRTITQNTKADVPTEERPDKTREFLN